MKLYLAFTGLIMIVQPQNPGPVDILFLNADDRKVEFEGNEIPVESHRLRLVFNRFSGSFQRLYPKVPVEMKVLQEVESSKVDLSRKGFLDFADLYEPDCQPKLLPQCRRGEALTKCKAGGRMLLTGRITLRGGTLQPAEILPRGIKLTAESPLEQPKLREECRVTGQRPAHREPWQMRPLHSPAAAAQPVEEALELTTFNGALYTLDLPPGTDEVSLRVGDAEVELPVTRSLDCALFGDEGECAYLVITNAFFQERDHLDPVPGVDLHFALNYNLLELPEGCPEFVPIWKFRDLDICDEPGGGTRCIPPIQGGP